MSQKDAPREAQPEPDAARGVQWGPLVAFAFINSISRHILENWIADHFAMGLSFLIASLVFFPFRTARKKYTLLRWVGLMLLIAAIATLATYLLGLIFD